MARIAVALGVAVMGVLYGLGAQAAESYDNPTTATSAPCVVLSHYDAQAVARSTGYKGRAKIENICGRSMAVLFCFRYAEPVNEVDRRCYQGALRPGESSEVELAEAPARLATPEFQWRYLP